MHSDFQLRYCWILQRGTSGAYTPSSHQSGAKWANINLQQQSDNSGKVVVLWIWLNSLCCLASTAQSTCIDSTFAWFYFSALTRFIDLANGRKPLYTINNLSILFTCLYSFLGICPFHQQWSSQVFMITLFFESTQTAMVVYRLYILNNNYCFVKTENSLFWFHENEL